MRLSVEEVEERLQEAVRVEASERRVGPRNVFCIWPEPLRKVMEAYGYTAAEARYVPTAAEVDRAAEVMLEWIPSMIKNPRFKPVRLYQRIVLTRAALIVSDRAHGFDQVAHHCIHLKRMSENTCKAKYWDAVEWLQEKH